jgi:hypothetical protein
MPAVQARALVLTSAAEVVANARAVRERLARLQPPPRPVAPVRSVVTAPIRQPAKLDPVPRAAFEPAWLPHLVEHNEMLRKLFARGEPSRIYGSQVRRAVAEHFGLTPAEIDGRQNCRRFARPRQIAMYICARVAGMSLPQIGRLLNRDHSTIHHGVRVVSARMAVNPILAAEIESIAEACFGGRP